MTVAGSGSAAWLPEPSRADDTYANRGELVTDWLKRSTVPRARKVRRFLNENIAKVPQNHQLVLYLALHERWHSAFSELIVARTLELLGAYPSYGMLAEEGGEVAGEEDARWVVDPLDGTTNYAHGLPLFSVSIALEKAGEVIVSVVYDPKGEEMFTAERPRGARLNEESIGVSDADELVRALVVTGFPYDRDEVPAALELFGRLSIRAQGMRRLGSAALDLCYVAAGRLDAYYESGIHAWDIAAAGLILEEAGGRITDYRGRPFEMEGGEMVASNGPLHPALIELADEFAG